MRLAAQAKGGFYPTPSRVVDLASALVSVGSYGSRRGQTLRILDPCCGAGEALEQLGRNRLNQRWGTPIETCGIELHRERAEEAADRLDRALAADLFQTSIANGAFGLLFLNPPYDSGIQGRQAGGTRLSDPMHPLPGRRRGADVHRAQAKRLAVSARYLSSHYWDLRCWAFSSPEREVFDQVVLMGRRRAEPHQDEYAEQQVREWSWGEPETLTSNVYACFSPPLVTPGDILFTTRTVDPIAAVAEAQQDRSVG